MKLRPMRMFLYLFMKILTASCLLCDDVLNMLENKVITINELRSMSPKDIKICLAHLGKDKLPEAETNYIWKNLVLYYNGTSNIPTKILILLHWITPALTSDDYSNITLSNIEVVRNFGLNYNLNQDQIALLADKIREEYAGKMPEDFTYYDLVALRQILCGFNRSEIEKIHPSAYREAASVIGKLENCPPDVMLGFASLAVQEKAFGQPTTWSRTTVERVGIVAHVLSQDDQADLKEKT